MDSTATAPPSVISEPATLPDPASQPGAVEQELLVEDVSIDGMCGVY